MITFSEVTKSFGDGTVALQNVSFHIEPGELVVITGPSGSGKTTLMKLLTRDATPTSGSVQYKGEAVEKLRGRQVPSHRRTIGVVFQDYRLLPELNVWENIALPLSIQDTPESEIESRVTDLLNLVSLTERALVFPKQLSGGEAQRVSIARALATGPSLIFADEPTGNLDAAASLGIVKLLAQINSLGTTVLIATHDITLLDFLETERHLRLEKGVLAEDTRPGKVPTPESESSAEAPPAPKKKATPASKPARKKAPSRKKAKPAPKPKSKVKAAPDTADSLAAEFQEVVTEAPSEEKDPS